MTYGLKKDLSEGLHFWNHGAIWLLPVDAVVVPAGDQNDCRYYRAL